MRIFSSDGSSFFTFYFLLTFALFAKKPDNKNLVSGAL